MRTLLHAFNAYEQMRSRGVQRIHNRSGFELVFLGRNNRCDLEVAPLGRLTNGKKARTLDRWGEKLGLASTKYSLRCSPLQN